MDVMPSRSCTVWVLARPDDPGLASLREMPGHVTCVVGEHPAEFEGHAPADAILVCANGRERLRETLALAPGVRWVHLRSAGIEGSSYPALADGGVVLTNGRGVFGQSLAEFALAAVFHFAKRLRHLSRQQDERRWEPYEPTMVSGRTMGIVGYGDIGRATAEKARALGMRVVALRRSAQTDPDPLVEMILPPDGLHALLAQSDFVVVATPLTDETRGLIDAAALAAMKPTAVLVNVGRGPVVDEQALVAALQGGTIAGAALDVFETEPLPAASPLWRLDNVLLSPHSADHVAGWLEDAMACFLQNLRRFTAGEPLANVVDPRRGY
jgi:phosphoglycerate dehydrogenase-like enzyme